MAGDSRGGGRPARSPASAAREIAGCAALAGRRPGRARTSWRWPIGPSGDRPMRRRSSPAWPRSRPDRSPPMPSSCWASRTSRPAVTPRPSRRWNDTSRRIPRGDVAEFALADLVAAQLGAGHPADADKTLETLARRFPDGKTLPQARLRVAEAALAAKQYDRAAEQFRSCRIRPPPPAPPIAAPRSASGPWPGWGIRSRPWAGRRRPPRRSAPVSTWPPPTPPHRRPRWPGPAPSRRRTGPRTPLSAYADAARQFAGRDEGPRAALARARLLAKLGRHEPAAAEYERLIDDAPARDALEKIGVTPDAMLAELGWSLVDAAKSEAGRSRLRPSAEGVSVESPCSRRAVQPGGIGQPGRATTRKWSDCSRPWPPRSRPPRDRQVGRSVAGPAAADRLMPAVLYRLGRTQVELRDWPAAASTLDDCSRSSPRIPIAARPDSSVPRRPCSSAMRPRPSRTSPPCWPSRRARAIPPGFRAIGPPGTDPLLGGAQALEGPDPGRPGAARRAEARRSRRRRAGLRDRPGPDGPGEDGGGAQDVPGRDRRPPSGRARRPAPRSCAARRTSTRIDFARRSASSFRWTSSTTPRAGRPPRCSRPEKCTSGSISGPTPPKLITGSSPGSRRTRRPRPLGPAARPPDSGRRVRDGRQAIARGFSRNPTQRRKRERKSRDGIRSPGVGFGRVGPGIRWVGETHRMSGR